jgi:hypothetical protein
MTSAFPFRLKKNDSNWVQCIGSNDEGLDFFWVYDLVRGRWTLSNQSNEMKMYYIRLLKNKKKKKKKI